MYPCSRKKITTLASNLLLWLNICGKFNRAGKWPLADL